MFKTGFILLIISSMLIPAAAFAGGIELHSEGVCPGDPNEGGELGPADTQEKLTPTVEITFLLLPISNNNIVYNPILIPLVVKHDERLKNVDLQISYANHR